MIDEKDDGRRPLPEQSGQQAGGFAREGAHKPKAQAGPPARAERRVPAPVGRGRLERRGDDGDRGRRELVVLAYMYAVLVSLVALGVPTEIALTASLSAGAAAARLLGLI